jgi:hypothetical protein
MARKIKDEANNFLKDILKVELSQEKIKITHVTQEKVNYLGFQISIKTKKYTESHIVRRKLRNNEKTIKCISYNRSSD